MKGWHALYQGNWHKIKGMEDTGKPAHVEGGGNVYHLEGVDKPVHQSKIKDAQPQPPKDVKKNEDKIPGGLADNKKPKDFDKKKLKQGAKVETEHTSNKKIAREIAMDHLTEDPKYYKKLKEVEKQDRIEVTADGKREIDVGAEPLDKQPNIKDRWNKLKKALDSSKAIMSIEAQEEPDEDDQEDSQQPQDVQDQGDDQLEQEDVGEESPEDSAPDEDQEVDESGEGQEMSEEDEQELAQMLAEDGYSEAEISHILHGHIVPQATVDDHKANNELVGGQIEQSQMKDEHGLEMEHKKRMHDLEYDKAKSEIADPETEKSHRKRMLDLEYEGEQKKKSQHELELEHKKRMLELEYEKAKKEASKEDPTDDMKRQQMEFELAMKRMEKELELEFKKKELALKLKIQEEQARQKAEFAAKQAEEDAKVNQAVKAEQAKHKLAEAKKPPKKEKANV